VQSGTGLAEPLAGVDAVIEVTNNRSQDEAEIIEFFSTTSRNLLAAGAQWVGYGQACGAVTRQLTRRVLLARRPGRPRRGNPMDSLSHDHHYGWILHRLWIATGNAALAYTIMISQPDVAAEPSNTLHQLRNTAHTADCPISTQDAPAAHAMRSDKVRSRLRELLQNIG
jgi:hypothetical protein